MFRSEGVTLKYLIAKLRISVVYLRTTKQTADFKLACAKGDNYRFPLVTLCATVVPALARTYDLHQVTEAWLESTVT